MKLFERAPVEEMATESTVEEQVKAWNCSRNKTRVAFGIYRADVYLESAAELPSNYLDRRIGNSPCHILTQCGSQIGSLSDDQLLAVLKTRADKEK